MLNKYSPARILAIVFLGIIFTGTAVLYLPAAQNPDLPRTGLIDCLFTATSAVCVTGLVVNTISDSFSLFGQLIILLLVQIGGLGYMTLATMTAMIFGKLPLQDKLVLDREYNQLTFEGIGKYVKRAVKLMVVFECAGMVLLFFCFLPHMDTAGAAYGAVFHSISAFCNAGFSTLPNNFVGFENSLFMIMTITTLSLCGGLGYIVLIELLNYRHSGKLSLHTKMVVYGTVCFMVFPTIFVLIAEYSNPLTLGDLSFSGKLVNAFFLSVSCKIAGFNSIAIGSFTSITLFLLIILMFIGGAPASTAGGIKITTFMVLASMLWSTLRGRRDTNFLGRRIDEDVIKKSFTVFLASLLWVCVVTALLLCFEKFTFIEILFECVSAFGIVGLSTGITPELSPMSKLIVMFTMFLGRLGPLTIGAAVLKTYTQVRVRYPHEKVLVG